MSLLRRMALPGLVVALSSGATLAHDVIAVANPKFSRETRVGSRQIEALLTRTPDIGARYVYEAALRWRPGQVLTGCFIGGDATQRALVERSRSEMLDGTGINISMNFRSGTGFRNCRRDAAGYYPEDVRVTFEGDDGCSAEIGRLAKSRVTRADGTILAKNPSVYIGPGCLGVTTIKHELLHALGFHHEHQKPGRLCRFKYGRIAEAYAWSEADVQANFDALVASNAFVSSRDFDDRSIMRYDFPQDFLETPDCVGQPGADLSDQDWLGLRAAYPETFSLQDHRNKLGSRGSAAGTVRDWPEMAEAIRTLE